MCMMVCSSASVPAVGVSLGVLTGFRGLCMGLGPAVFGVLFYLFHVDLGSTPTSTVSLHINSTKIEHLLPPALQVSPHHRDTCIFLKLLRLVST